MKKILQMGVFFLALGSLLSPSVWSADYPSKDVTNIIPWSAGGGTDAAMRNFMHYAEDKLGAQIFNQNITGAQSGIGVFKLMNARPDGYTIGSLTWDSVITVPYYKLVPGYDLSKLSYLSTVTIHPTALVVAADSPWKTLEDFVEDAKKNPGKYSVSNVGTGGVWHLPALDMADQLGIEIRHIPYPKGAGPQREALMSGETDAASLSISAAYPAIQAGTARVLAVMSEEREESLPEVPTFKELGYDVVWGSFRLVAIPKEAPKEAKDTLEKSFGQVFTDPEFMKMAKESGMGAVYKNAEDTAAYVETIQKKAFNLIDSLIEKGLLEPTQ